MFSPVSSKRSWILLAACLSCLTLVSQGISGGPGKSDEDKKKAELARYKWFDAPPLSPQKAAYINRIIELTVLDDLRQLKGPVDRQALRLEFAALQVDAIPLLVQWMDASAALGTCPCTVIGTKLVYFVDNGTGNEDLETIELINENLGRRLTEKKPPEAYRSLRASIANVLKTKYRDKEFALRAMKLDDAIKLATTLNAPKEKRPAEWRYTIAYLGRQKKDKAAFEFLLDTMDKTSMPVKRKFLHDALVEWSGVDHGPSNFQSAGDLTSSVFRWNEWYRAQEAAK